jgi:TPR repeat protein
MARLKGKALDGSKEAAAELAGINGFYSQIPEAILWGMIAAENGDKGALYNLAFVLANSPDPLQQRRARYWLKKMIDEKNEHSELAKNLLKQLESGKIDGSPFPERYPKW